MHLNNHHLNWDMEHSHISGRFLVLAGGAKVPEPDAVVQAGGQSLTLQPYQDSCGALVVLSCRPMRTSSVELTDWWGGGSQGTASQERGPGKTWQERKGWQGHQLTPLPPCRTHSGHPGRCPVLGGRHCPRECPAPCGADQHGVFT